MVEITSAEQNIEKRIKRNEDSLRGNHIFDHIAYLLSDGMFSMINQKVVYVS